MRKNQKPDIKSQIHIGRNSIDRLHDFLSRKIQKASGLFVLADSNTLVKCFPVISGPSFIERAVVIEIPAGETSKDIELCRALWTALNVYGADRNSLLISLGGGVISDIAGFIASTFKRGIQYINIPTTLLAMTDAAIGGKTGVDADGLKNLIGTFYPPEAVFISPAFLKTLPAAHLRSGYAEMLKHSLIADKSFWKKLKGLKPENITDWLPLIKRSAGIKIAVTEADPLETGLRKMLNFGHTVGHALESAALKKAKNAIMHGEAVAAGMICESYLSYKLTGLDEDSLDEICNTLLTVFGWKKPAADAEALIELMRSDKKNVNRAFQFTLIPDIGQVRINVPCPAEFIAESLKFYESLKY